MSDILDLDVLKPPEKWVKVGGKKINVGFLPAGITFKVQELSNKMALLDQKEVKKGEGEAEKGFNMMVDLCATFCTVKHPELTAEWLKSNMSPIAINKLGTAIQETLKQVYADIEKYSKNAGAGQ